MKKVFSTLSPLSAARTTALRLLAAWIPLSLAVGVAAWYYETERLERRVLADAIRDAQQIRAASLERYYRRESSIFDLHALARQMLGEFVSLEIYDRGGSEIAQEVSARAALVGDALWARAEASPLTAEPSYSQSSEMGRMNIVTAVPIRDEAGEVLGYVKGIYIATDATLAEMREDSLGASLLAVGCMLVSMLVVFPVVLFMQREHAAQTKRILAGNVALLEVLGNAVAHRDSDTDIHNYRVTLYALRLAEHLGLGVDSIRIVIIGAFLHDVGKIGITDSILLKPGKLTEAEFEIMKTHVSIGAEIVRRSPWLAEAVKVVESHHEKFDGSGYPKGLAGEAIPIEARVFSVADVFDALTTRRPYKEAFPIDKALDILRQDSGRHFDPEILCHFESLASALHAELAHMDADALRDLMHAATQHYLIGDDELVFAPKRGVEDFRRRRGSWWPRSPVGAIRR